MATSPTNSPMKQMHSTPKSPAATKKVHNPLTMSSSDTPKSFTHQVSRANYEIFLPFEIVEEGKVVPGIWLETDRILASYQLDSIVRKTFLSFFFFLLLLSLRLLILWTTGGGFF
jgi:hypothetical protein